MVWHALRAVAELLALIAEAFLHLPREVGAVDELDLAPAVLALPAGDDPDVGGDAGIVKELIGQADDGLQHVILNDPAADVALAAARVAGEERRAIEDDADARTFAAILRRRFHLRNHVEQEEQRAIVDARQAGTEAALEAKLLVLLRYVVLLRLPLHAEGRVREHVVKPFVRMAVAIREAFLGLASAERVAIDDVLHILALDHEVGAADGVGLGIVFLAEEFEVCARVESGIGIDDEFLRLREHAAGAAGGVVDFDDLSLLVNEVVVREEKAHHELDDFARGEMVSRLLVGLLVEAPD